MSWKQKLSFLTPQYVEHSVQGETYKFYPISVGLAFQLREIGKPLAKAIAAIFEKTDNDTSTREMTGPNDEGNGFFRQVEASAISPELARERHTQRVSAIEALVDSLTCEKNLEIVGTIIMDSLREVFPPSNKDNPPVKEFMNSTPLPAIPDLIIGVAKANKGVLGPLTDRLGSLVEAVSEKVGAKLELASPKESVEPTPAG